MKKNISAAVAVVLLLCMTGSALAASAPVAAEQKNIDGTEYITKVYTLPADADPAALVEDDFAQGGYIFAHHTTVADEVVTVERKSITEAQSVETESKALENVLHKLPSTIAYDEDGWRGTLVLDTGSIATEAVGYTTTSRTISTTQTYPTLISSIPQTALKDGVSLPLTNVSWTVTGTSLAGDSLVPTEYTATATYSKKVSSQIATGYVSTAIYTGEVSRESVTAITYTLTYMGTAIPESAPEPKPEPLPWGRILAGLALLLALGGGIAAVLFIRSQQGVAVYNLVGDDYLCIGRQRLEVTQPAIALDEFGDMVQSRHFSFVLDKPLTRKLFGRNLTVTLGDITMTHRVKEAEGKYRFNLEMGAEL